MGGHSGSKDGAMEEYMQTEAHLPSLVSSAQTESKEPLRATPHCKCAVAGKDWMNHGSNGLGVRKYRF